MGTLLRLPPALLAVLPLLTGPAAWANDCGCGVGCEPAAVADAGCGCDDAACAIDENRAIDDGCACGCVVERPEPLSPAAPGGEPPPIPAAAPSRPIAVAAANAGLLLRNSEEPDPAATPPRRALLCVWRI
ncbi:hypothetical protein [Alienimonas sp. DA493]|uniref:hypothetical protein n=1 Tax=Alienimonas sp. DA493 TaxID=3373605 RepID=UPI00375461C8